MRQGRDLLFGLNAYWAKVHMDPVNRTLSDHLRNGPWLTNLCDVQAGNTFEVSPGAHQRVDLISPARLRGDRRDGGLER